MDPTPGETERNASDSAMCVLLIEDNRADAVLLRELLLDAGRATFDLTWDDCLGKAVDRLKTERFDAILLDMTLPDSQGSSTLDRILSAAAATPIIVLTGVEDEAVAIRAIRQGAQDYLVKGTVDGRIIARAIRYAIDRKQAEQALREARDRLEERVRERTAELTVTNARLQALASELSLAEERERRRLAAVLHDDVGQTMALAKLKLGLLGQLLKTADSKAALAEVRELINQMAKRVRTLTSDLSPPILYQLGLTGAVEWLGERFGQQYGVCCRCQAMGDPQGTAEAVNVLLFQSARELLANIGKHAHAHDVEVALAYGDGGVTLAVRDDGDGFEPDSLRAASRTKESFGLFSIEERMRHIGGTMRIESAPGKGTTVTLTCPGTPRRA